MLITTAFSLFFLFWSLLFLIDFYLRTTHNEKYLCFVERNGLTITPFQFRFYVSRADNASVYLSLAFVKTWSSTSSQRFLRFLSYWFSTGAFVGLFCFIITPLYLTWLLVMELGNVWTMLKWRSTNSMSILHASYAAVTGAGSVNNIEEAQFNAAISDLSLPEHSFFYVPLQEHVQTGITPVIPGVNIPWSHLPLFMFVLVIAGIFHELGHAVAALNANIRLNGFGVFVFAVYPGAFTEIETDELMRSSTAQKLRIFSAGIWHNIILALIGVLILWCAPFCFIPFYESGSGVLVTDVNEKSGLYGATGFQPGHIVTRINQCQVHNSSEWTHCLEKIHKENSHSSGYLLQYSKVLPLTASPSNVVDATGSGEIHCCGEFGNVTPSHICFRYFSSLAQIFKPREGGGGGGELSAISAFDNSERKRNKQSVDIENMNERNSDKAGGAKVDVFDGGDASTMKTTPAISFADSLLGVKTRVKRANFNKFILDKEMEKSAKADVAAEVKDQELDDPKENKESNPTGLHNADKNQAPLPLKKSIINKKNSVSSVDADELNNNRIATQKYRAGLVRHACLPARQVTDHATCEQLDVLKNIKRVPAGYVCAVPALYNGTALLRFELKNHTRPILFVGFLSEPLYMIDLLDITPRFSFVPFWIPLLIELFGKYLVTFSLAMALLNAVPCHGLDGQFMCQTIVDYFCSGKSSAQRQKISSRIVAFGTTIFCLNVTIGFTKFLYNYWK